MKKINQIFILSIAFLMLTACSSKWSVDVDLSPDEVAQVKAGIEETKEIIKGQIKNRASGQAEPMAYVNLARGYKKLGELKKVESTYKKAIARGSFSSALHNNLARLYEEVGDHDKAIEQYKILVDTFGEETYLYDITWAYIHKKDRKEAEKAFNMWQRMFQKTDEAIQEAIKQLREEEFASQ